MVSRKSKTSPTHVPRPANMYMLFRRARQAEIVAENTDPTVPPQQNLSKRIGREWNALSPEDRRYWKVEAEKEKREHKRLYPNYKFAP
ncbi:high mobility group box domain-containing protein, partial [Schizophyllum amplum]